MNAKRGQFYFMVVAVAALILASCSRAAAPSDAGGTPGGQNKPYGSLTAAAQFGTGQVDPKLISSATFTGLGQTVFDTLFYYDNTYVLKPGIAERWEVSADGKTHTFYVRKGVQFHDGSELTAADVKFSIERLTAPDSVTQSYASQWRTAIESIELKDDYTVLLHLKQPRFELLQGTDSMGAVMPKKYIQEKGEQYFSQHPIGSGPWKVVSLELGNRLELEAVERHWRAVPKFQKLTLLNVPNEATRVAMLKTGELDMAVVAVDSIAGVKAAGLRIISTPEGAGLQYYNWFWWDLEHPETSPFSDVRVRKAMQLGINSQELANGLFAGFGGPYYLLFIHSKADFFDPAKMKPDPYDPEGAKKLLAEAGYPNGFPTKLWDHGGGAVLSLVNQSLADYWRKIGLSVTIQPMEYSAMRSQYNPKVVPALWNTIWTMVTQLNPDMILTFPLAFATKGSSAQNATDVRIDRLIEASLAEKNPQERSRIRGEMVVMAKQNYTTFSVVQARPTAGINPKRIGDEVQTLPIGQESFEARVYEGIPHAK